ncbi:Pkinase domain-containing protein/GUB_WAK_bind domain-containing protein [Cephalotus follicularis]|uniref:Pkinase domain-containing protein/GUB_WAK_bind domain-containing protein n=1 Tax=Cephalotus follicularis TaxID=3775 RepID=A0A1Q3D2W3_CEPFO|nr:Pkinase domain-containing protein/GUB_WAK_bind domain-containing protein [Cephalotus follicularis]
MKNLLIVISIFTLVDSIAGSGGGDNSTTCDRGCGSKKVPYPFGFTPGCPILLNCEETKNEVKIGGFEVQNITWSKILINLTANCYRGIDSLVPLFGPNYALTFDNNLLLSKDCSNVSSNGCVLSTSYLEDRFNLTSCGGAELSCLFTSRDQNTSAFMSFEDVNRTRCRFLYSSFVVDSGMDSGVSLEFLRLELAWWLRYPLPCHEHASLGDGYRCQCNPGYEGDGFVHGDGCLRASYCNLSKYMSGKCGGTTRVGVLVGGLIAGASLMAGLALICCFVRRRSISLKSQTSAKRLLCEAAGNSSVPFFPYKEIEKATSGFSENQRLGTGAYGTVYAGKLHNDEWVAIKRIRHRDTDSIDQVMNEIKLLSSVSHPNLVRLLGCCIEEGEPILVYEFMANGTLSQHLQRERGRGLPWTIRLTVATETAKAIAYLHSAMNPPIYHRDIKSSNILLDYNYKSKVADFGLSRLGMTETSHISTAPQGTPGYLDPQYHQYFHLSDKSDVYSFGVVLVEIITGLKVVDFSRPHSEVNLAALAIDRIGRGCVDEIIDQYLEPHRDAWTLTSIHNVAELAFRCLAFHRDMRPTMMEVAEELEQIRLSSWVPNMCLASPETSSCTSADIGSEKSLSCLSIKKAVVGSRRVIVSQRAVFEEVKDRSPVSVQDHWLSEQSSPSTNSLLESGQHRSHQYCRLHYCI